jgi:hypothetical protein
MAFSIDGARRRLRRLWRRGRYLAGKFAVVRGPEWGDVARGQIALLRARAIVATRPEGELTAPRGARAPVAGAPAPAEPTAEQRAAASRLALGVTRAAAYGVFRPLCLVRAVALHGLLERHGMPGSEVRVGVRWTDGKFAAHAWVEYGGAVLGDEEAHVRGFAELEDLQMVGRRP